MKIINKIASVLLLSFAYQLVQAMPVKPNKCPSVSAIKSRGLDVVASNFDGWSVGVISEKYDTNVPFTFVIGYIRAKDADTAKTIALEALNELVFVNGPTYNELTQHWICQYRTRYPAQAWTPVSEAS